MRNYLTSLARRGAGLTAERFPQPSHTPNFPAEVEGTKSDASPFADGEIESASPSAVTSDSAQATQIATREPHQTSRSADESSRVKERVRVEGNVVSRTESSSAPVEPSPRNLPDVKTAPATTMRHEQSINAPQSLRPSAPSPLSTESAIKDEAPEENTFDESSHQRNESGLSQPQAILTPAAQESSTILEKETVLVEPAQREASVVPQPQSSPRSLAVQHTIEAAPEQIEPHIEVRIGRVEVRFAQPPPPQPAPRESSKPRGFRGHALARRYLDRNWY